MTAFYLCMSTLWLLPRDRLWSSGFTASLLESAAPTPITPSAVSVIVLPIASSPRVNQLDQEKHIHFGSGIHGPREHSGFSGGSDGKESACSAGDTGSVSRHGRFPGEGNDYPPQDSCLENSMGKRVWRGGHKESDITEGLHFHFSQNINKGNRR